MRTFSLYRKLITHYRHNASCQCQSIHRGDIGERSLCGSCTRCSFDNRTSRSAGNRRLASSCSTRCDDLKTNIRQSVACLIDVSRILSIPKLTSDRCVQHVQYLLGPSTILWVSTKLMTLVPGSLCHAFYTSVHICFDHCSFQRAYVPRSAGHSRVVHNLPRNKVMLYK